MIINVLKLGKRLQGKLAGRKHFGELCSLLSDVGQEEFVFLDFDRVESVNASWINSVIAPLFRWAAEPQNDYFPILARFPDKDLDELELVANTNKQLYVLASEIEIPLPKVQLVGSIDTSLLSTLFSVVNLREATGAQLSRNKLDSNILATAWNNRLKDLHDMRLLRRTKSGREQVYSPLAKKVVMYG